MTLSITYIFILQNMDIYMRVYACVCLRQRERERDEKSKFVHESDGMMCQKFLKKYVNNGKETQKF